MAVILQTVSTFGRLVCGLARSSGAAARVFCGIDSPRLPKSNANSFFKDEDSSGLNKSKSAAVGVSHSTDLPARCQAAVAVRPLPTKQVHILEPDSYPSTRPATIDQFAHPLPRSFLAESVTGTLVECSGRGSRPLYSNVLAEFQLTFSGGVGAIEPDISPDCSELRAAIADNPGDARLVSEFAMFTWKSVGDVNSAEALFERALEMAPDDPAIQANHALFLWQCEG